MCKFTYPKSDKKYEHCSACEVCVAGPDHHCGVFEKCIGRKNIICFYLFRVQFVHKSENAYKSAFIIFGLGISTEPDFIENIFENNDT